MDRRLFLSWFGLGIVAGSLPAAIAACSSNSSGNSNNSTPVGPTGTPTPVAPRADGFTPVGTVKELTENGFVQNQKSGNGDVLVVRNPQEVGSVVAVDARCPHRNCSVTWNPTQTVFVCPCHNSRFAADGQVLQGPATAPLKTLAAKVEGDSVLVRPL